MLILSQVSELRSPLMPPNRPNPVTLDTPRPLKGRRMANRFQTPLLQVLKVTLNSKMSVITKLVKKCKEIIVA